MSNPLSPVYKLRNRLINKPTANMPATTDTTTTTTITSQPATPNRDPPVMSQYTNRTPAMNETTFSEMHGTITALTRQVQALKHNHTVIEDFLARKQEKDAEQNTGRKVPHKDIPKDISFNGNISENAINFLDKLTQFARYMNMTDSDLCSLFPLILTEKAYKWFGDLPDTVTSNWTELKKQFIQQFGPHKKGFVFKMSLLNRTQQPGETVDDYIIDLTRRFDLLGTTDPDKWETFVKGLHPKIKAFVLQHDVTDFNHAEQLARRGEQVQIISNEDVNDTLTSLLENYTLTPKSQSSNQQPSTENPVDTYNNPRHRHSRSPYRQQPRNGQRTGSPHRPQYCPQPNQHRGRNRSTSFQPRNYSAGHQNYQQSRYFQNPHRGSFHQGQRPAHQGN